ncbi:hypothetical protein LSH36_61g08010 [Paralvinella palmiformis]|uniref:Sulfotransferase domain-containing protein n=1 Tax=Paralvinella palmiformis TaxID=53620 RepID=A0AAD9NEV1_9ANNE|nr:hypothetical protein LSH36_61g08010 [Paralvinella palmiformis]
MGKYWLPFEFFKEKNKLKDVKEFHVHDSDVIIASFPKSGTTWIQEIVHQLSDGLSESEELTIEEIFPYIEYVYPGLKHLAKCTSPRYMKTHLPYELLPDDVYTGHGKVIYIARNVKDVSVSYFHFIKMLTITKYSGEFNDFLTTFVDGKDHVLGYWKQREQSNILFISYEDLHKNPVVVIKQISSFLGKSVDEKQMLEIAFQCSFSQMKSNPLVNYSWWHDLGISDKKQTDFMRKGKVGDWMNYYTEDMLKKINVCCIEPAEKEQLILKDNL